MRLRRPRMAPSAFVWLLLAAVYFLLPLYRDARLQPQGEQDRHAVLHALELQLGAPQRRLLAHDQDLVPARDRDDRDQPPPLRADDLLGAPEAAAAAAGDRVHGARPVRGAADRDGRRPAAHVPRHAELVLRRAVGLPRDRVRDPRVPVHVLLAGRRFPVDRRAHADRGVAEPRRELDDDADPRDPPEHPRSGARRLVPDARDRDGRVHDREPRRRSTPSRSSCST